MRCLRVSAVWLVVCLATSLVAETTELNFVVSTSQPVAKEDNLYLSGNVYELGNWNPSGVVLERKSDTTFEAQVELEVGKEIEFKITRGTWGTVENATDGVDIANRTVSVKRGRTVEVDVESWADQRVRASQSSVVGTLEIRRITTIEPARLVRVWLPVRYQDSTQSYPVLYMLDGQNVFDRATSAIGEEWGIDETLAKLIESKAVPSLIVVAVDNGPGRVDEYTPFSDDDDERKRGGNASLFAKWLVEELKPQMDREYRTLSKRETTWIGGSSLGGLFALYAVVQHNETFGGAIAMSPSLGWGNEGMHHWLESSLRLVTASTRVWVDFGGKEGTTVKAAKENTERFERFQETLRQIAQNQTPNIQVGGGLFPEAKHQESAWRGRFATAIEFLTQ